MKRSFFFPLAVALSAIALPALAFATVPPTLQLAATGTGDNVTITVHGDPNASVLLSYTQSGSGPMISSLGTTDGSGSFTSTVSSATYGIASGSLVYAIVGGTGGPHSQTVTWPTVTAANSLTLSQSAVVLNAGQSTTVTASNVGGGTLYVSNNSNPPIANVSVSGANVSISGNTAGQTTVTVCAVGNTNNCPSVSVTVLNAGAGQLTFSSNNVTVVPGQNLPVTISGGNGVYTIRSNSNSSVIQSTISGSVLTLSTTATTGSASVTVCSTDLGACGVVNASAGSQSSENITFSNSAPTVMTNQSASVNVYGPSGVTFYVSSNSNPQLLQANLSGTTLTLTGINVGTSNLSICATTNTCANLPVTVQQGSSGQNLALSQNAVNILVGQNVGITISGGTQPYAVQGGISSVAQETISGSTMTVYGVSAGTSSVNVCSSAGGCANLAITVSSTGGSTANSAFSLAQNALTLSAGKAAMVPIYGGGSYYLSGNTSPGVATIIVSGSNAVVSALSAGASTATICANAGSCASLAVTVTGGTSGSTSSGSASGSVSGQTNAYTFTSNLAYGANGTEVLQLQKTLANLGYLTATPNGHFGPSTEAAVKAYQKAHGMEQAGVVGPQTRAALNAASGSAGSSGTASTGSTSDISSMNLAQLKALVQTLQAQLNTVLNRIATLGG